MHVPVKHFVLVVVAFLALAASAQTAPQRPDYTYWPQEDSDLTPDPAVRYGVLTNGLRYAIMRNTQPGGAVSLRLRIAAGALQESDAQRGLAHFMEHMAFNGSKNVPEGEFIKLLQRKGLAFGPHTNAYTSTFETVYMLDLPRNDADLIDTGLMLFREIGDRLTLDAAAIDHEKGVILAERTSRNTPDYRVLETRWRLAYEGQRTAERLPVGTEATIKGASHALLADYYTRFYRPERALLVATGDFDPAAMEAKIKAKFSDWIAQGPPTGDPSIGPVKQRGLIAATHIEANLPEDVTVSWYQPPEDLTDSSAERKSDATRGLAIDILNRRFERIARQPNAPFLGASLSRNETRHAVVAVDLYVNARPGQWRTAMSAAEQEVRRALLHGFQQQELDREIAGIRAQLQDAIIRAASRDTSSLAGALAALFASRGVLTEARYNQKLFEAYASTLAPASLLAALRETVRGEGPVILISAGHPIEGGTTAITAAYTASVATPVPALNGEAFKDFPYTDFGAAGTIASRSEAKDLGATLVRFANGVTLNVKPTPFEKDTIYVATSVAGGYVVLPRNKIGLHWVLPGAFIQGGLGKLTAQELQDTLVGRIASIALDLTEQSFLFTARTNAHDLAFQMQLMTAFVTDPAYRAEAMTRRLDAAEGDIPLAASSPSGVLNREAAMIVRSGDPRWASPTVAQVRALTAADVAATMRPALASEPIEITIVGDVSVDAAIAAVASTFGALKPRAAKPSESAAALNVHFPAHGAVHRFVHEGPADQAVAYAAWPASDFYSDPRRVPATAILCELINLRLLEEFREVQGATYTPSVGSLHSDVFPNFGFIGASAETKPELVDAFYKTLDGIVAELKDGQFSDDLIARARTPLIESAETNRRQNGYWLFALSTAQREPRQLATMRSQISDLKSVTKAELVALAKQYLDNARRVEIRVLPRAVAGR